jgi:sugar phosphate isomerase/epimerase
VTVPEAPESFPPLPAIRGRTPWRVGVTSFVYFADILPNVAAVASAAEDVELVFFEADGAGNLPTPALVRQLRTIAQESGLTFTVHLPINRKLGSADPAERTVLSEQMQRIVDLTAPLSPHAWILHLEGIAADAAPDEVARWQERMHPHAAALARAVPSPDRLSVENLDYPFEWCAPFLDEFGFSQCLDVGHLWLTKCDWRAHVTEHLPRARVIHLYGIGNDTAHHSLATAEPALAREFLASLDGFGGVLTLETFGHADTRSSMEALITWHSQSHVTPQ